MRKLACLGVALVLLTVSGRAALPPIDADRLLNHIKFLASDEMKGRADGSPELNRAADYIAGQFKDIGLTPGGDLSADLPAETRSAKADDRSWFQPFDLVAGLAVGKDNSLV